MPNRNVIVIGGSAGSGNALREIFSANAWDLRAVTFVAIHRTRINGVDYLPSCLDRLGNGRAAIAQDGQVFEPGQIYVAPCEGHLLIDEHTLRIETGGSSRNSIDALFQSAAVSHGSGVIGVLVSGMLTDGTAGFWQIRKHGGITISQDPSDAQYSSMPHNAMKDVPVDYCLRASEIGLKLKELVEGSAAEPIFRTGRVMIVEDDWLLAADLEMQLHDLGYDVVANVVSGEEALSRAPDVRPDVVIMDVRLAGKMKGTEAARDLRERFQIPTIFLTAYADLETLSAARAAAPYAFVAKPHHATELNFALQLALGPRDTRVVP